MTTHTDLIARLRAYPTRDGVEAADAIESLEQQVATLTMEKNDWYRYHGHVTDELVISQARETKLRSLLLNVSEENLCVSVQKALALPTDDSALMERLKQERERAVREYIEMLCHDEGYWCFVCGRFLPANEDGVIVHDNVPHPEEMTFDEEERPQ